MRGRCAPSALDEAVEPIDEADGLDAAQMRQHHLLPALLRALIARLLAALAALALPLAPLRRELHAHARAPRHEHHEPLARLALADDRRPAQRAPKL